MPRRENDRGAALERTYEGESVLARLLGQAGSPASVAEVVDLMREAQAAGMGADEALPDLFDEEPRFPSAADAQRLYANLLGLWDRVAAGGPLEAAHPAPHERAKPPPPLAGPPTDEFVEAAWKHLADLVPRDQERWLHRWENTQPDLTEAIREEAADDEAVLENADTLCFELWAMLELARARPSRAVSRDELERALAETGEVEPALERYIDEALEEARLDEAQPLSPPQAEKVARIARAVVRGLSRARGER